MAVSLFRRGLLLLAVPFVTQLIFLALTVRFRDDADDAQRWSSHTREVITTAHMVTADVNALQAGTRGHVLTRDPVFAEPAVKASRALPENLALLRKLVQDNPTQTARAAHIEELVTELIATQAECTRLIHGQAIDQAAALVVQWDGERKWGKFHNEMGEFLAAEEEFDRVRSAQLAQSRDTVDGLLAVAAVCGFIATGAAALLFRHGISRRFKTIVDNTRRLATGQELTPPLGGTDEIAHLDREFRSMADDLARAADRSREATQEIHDLYDQAPCGYHSVRADGVIAAMNRTELRWLGYEPEEVIGQRTFASFVTPETIEDYRGGFARVREDGGVSNVEVELTRRDGTTFPVLINSSSIRGPDGQFLRSRSNLTDLTERKRAEDEIRRLNTELEARVVARTAELAAANRELVQKNDENEMFVYSVSHDLRSPLVNLQGFSAELGKACDALAAVLAAPEVPDEARQAAQKLLDGKMKKSLGFIRAAVTRLATIIDALLRLSRAGRVEYRWEVVDVRRIVGRVLDATQSVAAEKKAKLTVGELPEVWGDATALEQVFANLVGNALTYLDPVRPGAVEVGFDPEARAYFVRDNGLGIAQAHRAKIFQVFQRAHPGVGTGEGIGLAIVARVVDRHRGRVWIESRVGEGSTFYVALPTSPSQTPSGSDRPSSYQLSGAGS